jgi:hypothetical protein
MVRCRLGHGPSDPRLRSLAYRLFYSLGARGVLVLNDILSAFDELIETGGGIAAQLLGQYCTVYRVSSTTNVSVLQDNPINGMDIFPAEFDRTTDRKVIETATFDLVVFAGTCDPSVLQIGDILVDNATGERYCYGQRRVLDDPLFAEVDHLATISLSYNPASAPTVAPGAPRGVRVASRFGGNTISATAPITLTAGVYAVGAVGATPAQIPVGVSMLDRLGNVHGDQSTSEQTLKSNYMIYIPPMPGITLRENALVTILDVPDLQFNVVDLSTSEFGFVGTVAIAQKVAVG